MRCVPIVNGPVDAVSTLSAGVIAVMEMGKVQLAFTWVVGPFTKSEVGKVDGGVLSTVKSIKLKNTIQRNKIERSVFMSERIQKRSCHLRQGVEKKSSPTVGTTQQPEEKYIFIIKPGKTN